jgi:hypothetical protein
VLSRDIVSSSWERLAHMPRAAEVMEAHRRDMASSTHYVTESAHSAVTGATVSLKGQQGPAQQPANTTSTMASGGVGPAPAAVWGVVWPGYSVPGCAAARARWASAQSGGRRRRRLGPELAGPGGHAPAKTAQTAQRCLQGMLVVASGTAHTHPQSSSGREVVGSTECHTLTSADAHQGCGAVPAGA